MSKFVSRFLILVALALTGIVQADNFDEQIASVLLLQSKPVQKELGITDKQRAAMNKYADAHRIKLQAVYKEAQDKQKKTGKLEVDQAKMISMFNDMKRGVFSQMTPAQIKRLREISLQALDFTALADQTVATRVGLSAAEEKRIQSLVKFGLEKANKIRNDAVNQETSDIQKRKPKDAQEMKALQAQFEQKARDATTRVLPRIEQVRSDAKKQVLAVLTQPEKAKWQTLLGKPFHPS